MTIDILRIILILAIKSKHIVAIKSKHVSKTYSLSHLRSE